MTEAASPPAGPGVFDHVAEPYREAVRQYTALVQDIAGPRAKGLALFGPIVNPGAAGFDPKRQAIRSVLVMDPMDLDTLRHLAEHGPRLGSARISAPVVMTPHYIEASADTFPLELIEIQQQHLTLFGQDYFKDLSFDDAHVRLQCERELKVFLIGLRQGLLAAAGRDKFLSELELGIAEGLMRPIRGMLWLKEQRESRPPATMLVEIEKIAERQLPGIRAALTAGGAHGWPQFEALYRDVEALGEIADAW